MLGLCWYSMTGGYPKYVMEGIARKKIRIGVIGLGLMGTSIAACLLGAGYPVAGVELDAFRRKSAEAGFVRFWQLQRKKGS
jgi:3-hydroxybutyryl-CoA dehydrogenase